MSKRGRREDTENKKTTEHSSSSCSSSESESDNNNNNKNKEEDEEAEEEEEDSTSNSSSRSSSPEKKKRKSRDKKRAKKTKRSKLPGDVPRLSIDDYYRRNQEFQMWLIEEHETRFTDLPSSKHQKSYFKKFVKKWNSGQLAEKYYGIGPHPIPISHRTSYQWKFSNAVAKGDDKETQTIGPQPMVVRRDVPHGPSYIPEDMSDDQRRSYEKKLSRQDSKKYHRRKEDALDELVPKPSTTHESKVDKSKMRRQVKQEKEENDVVVNEYDDGSQSFKAMLDRQQEWRDRMSNEKREKIQQKMGEYRLKEDKTMAMLRELAASKGYL